MRFHAFRAAVLLVVVCAGVMAVGASPAVAAVPAVSSFSPASGPLGTTVTITGSGFTGATKVTFGSVASQFTVKSAAKITATVPLGASTGPITVTAPGGTASSTKNFTVTFGVHITELTIGEILFFVVIFGGPAMLYYLRRDKKRKARARTPRIRSESVVAAVMAYGIYIGTALWAGASFPQFLRDHLFDGLILAGLVGLLIDNLPQDKPLESFPRIPWPVMILVVFYLAGAVIFALIAATAIFSSGKNDYALLFTPVYFGGFIFPQVYWFVADDALQKRQNPDIGGFKWWFKKRPKPEATQADAAT